MREQLLFLKTFLMHPTQVGAIAPSSAGLVKMMVGSIDWQAARSIVEYGPGTGVFTAAILEQLQPGAQFFAIERSPDMVRAARERCPAGDIVEDSVTNVASLCASRGISQIDAIVCGLPWASFSESLQAEIMEAMFSVLRPGGQFATFAYLQGLALPAGRRFSHHLDKHFSVVKKSPTVWRNLPPAFVYRCVR
jgi:phosphatidylethanolamine/phosphatidyl-N-methylethanolamine N-methyltransferase